jgi:hypothetical protein
MARAIAEIAMARPLLRIGIMRFWIAWLVGLVAYAPRAMAEPTPPGLAFGAGKLVGPVIAPAGRIGQSGMSGAFLGIDGGWSIALPSSDESASGAWGFGARFGYAWRSGLSIQARYDDLGVHPTLGDPTRTPLQLGTIGARYEVPFMLMPFGEALAGAAFDGSDARFAAAAGLGLALPIARHASIEAVARDWFVPGRFELRQIVVLRLGLTIGFGSSK